MDMLKKEWKSLVIIVFLIGITFFLFKLRDQFEQLQAQNAKISDTLETVEGIIIGTDSGVVEINKSMKSLGTQVDYIRKRIRRR